VCEISTEGECLLFETVVEPPLSDFDLYCGYEDAWDKGFYYQTHHSFYFFTLYAVTPCWIGNPNPFTLLIP
jgi:hypothetical protein